VQTSNFSDLDARVAALPRPSWWSSARYKQAYAVCLAYAAEDTKCDELMRIYRDFIVKESLQAQTCPRCVRRFKTDLAETLKLVQEVEAQIKPREITQ
jgi:hypothetical protein